MENIFHNRGMCMKKNILGDEGMKLLKIYVVIFICLIFIKFGIPAFVTCIFIALGYLYYEAFKKS